MNFNLRAHIFLVRWILIGVLIQVLVLFLAIPVFTEYFPGAYMINSFPDGYDKLAANVLAGNGYRFFPDTSETLMRTPGYPLFLALIFYFFPNSLVAVKIVNLTLGLLTAWIVAALAWRFTANKVAIIFASLLFLLHPATIFAQSRGGVESLFTFCTVGFVLAMCRAFEQKKLSDYVIAGVFLGLLTLVKSTGIFFPIFLLGCLVATRKRNVIVKFWMPRLVLMGSIMLVVLLPWFIRNYSLVNQFIPTMTVSGIAAFDGLYACKNYSFDTNANQLHHEASRRRNEIVERLDLRDYSSGYFPYFFNAKDEVDFNQYLLRSVFEEYRNSPGLLLQCSLLNAFNFWFAGRTWSSTYLNMLIQIPYLILSTIGIYFCTKGGYGKQMFPILAFAAYFFILHLPINAIARYSVPLIPFLAIFSGIALDELQRRYAMHRSDTLEI